MPARRQAKLDALALLGACAAGYGPGPLADHTSSIWAALRAELAAPAAEGLLPADLAAADELAGAASDALARCVAAAQAPAEGQPAGDASLAHAVLADSLLADVLACVRSPGSDPAMHRRSALRARAGVRAARALCAAGGAAAAKALEQQLPPLLDVAGEPTAAASRDGSWQARCLAWAAVADLLEATAAAPAGSHALPVNGALLQQVVATAAAGLAAAAAEQQAGVAAMEEDTEEQEEEGGASRSAAAERWALHPSDCTQLQVTSLQLAALATVFGDARQVAALEQPQLEAAMAAALQLLAVAGGSRRRQQAAVAPLTALAGGSRAAVLAEGALPRLVAAAGDAQSAGAALAALRALAAASSSLQLEIVMALDQAIQQQLPAVAAATPADAGSSGSDRAALLLQLLTAATAIVSAASISDGAAAPPAFLHLGQHVLDSVLLLPQQAAAGPELVQACAELAYHAVRGAAADQQQPLAAAAAEALQEQQAPGQLQAAVCCALLAPLWPAAANACAGGQLPELVQRLVGLAVQQQAEGPLASWAGLAAALLLNKWTTGGQRAGGAGQH